LAALEVEEMRRRMAGARVARMAMVAPDGAPRLVPVCFALSGDRLVTAIDGKPKSTRRLARLAAIAREPRVSLLADAWSENWSRLWWVRADGEARVTELDADSRQRLAAKYSQYSADPPAGPMIEIVVRRWTGWSAR
jgi:PPOX class probable F420-dependent enzyme